MLPGVFAVAHRVLVSFEEASAGHLHVPGAVPAAAGGGSSDQDEAPLPACSRGFCLLQRITSTTLHDAPGGVNEVPPDCTGTSQGVFRKPSLSVECV